MPVIKSAIKKLKQDRKREKENDMLRDALKSAVRTAKKDKSSKSVAKAVSTVDKAAKHKIIHSNKASRLKAALSKIAKPVSVKKTEAKNAATSTKTTPKKKVAPKRTSSK